jgi:hypothetical protein
MEPAPIFHIVVLSAAFTAASRRATAESSRTQPKYNNRLTLGIHSVPAHRQHPQQHAHQHHDLAYFDADEVALLAASRGSGSGSNSERKQAQAPPSSSVSSALPRHPSHSSLDGRLHAPDVSVLSATAAPQRVLSLTRSRLDKSVSAASLSGLEELDDSGSGSAQTAGGASSAAGSGQQAATGMSVLQATRSRSSARRPLGASPVPAELAQLPELDPLELPAAVLALTASEPRRAQVSTTPQQQQQQLQPSPLAASASFSAVSSPSPQSAFFTISASSGDPPPQQRGRPAGSAWGALSSRSEASTDGLPSVGPLIAPGDAPRSQALPAAASATVLNGDSGGSPSASPAAASASVVPGRVTVVRGSGAVASAPGAAGRDRTQPADPSAAKNGCCAVM